MLGVDVVVVDVKVMTPPEEEDGDDDAGETQFVIIIG